MMSALLDLPNSYSAAEIAEDYRHLTPEEQAEVDRLLASTSGAGADLGGGAYCPHAPTDRQKVFLALNDREALYGGAAGGGKSDALLMAALQYVHVKNYRALLLRRTFADLSLPGALMDRARDWIGGTDAKWMDREHSWVFPSGATVTFGYLDNVRDKYRYQGAEFQFVGWDELTQFPEDDYRYLFSRLRRLEGAEVPLRMRAASNPGGVGHEWVRLRFGLGLDDEGNPLPTPAGRVFIPARLSDNPYLDQAEYEASLAELDPITRRQLLAGDWTARTTTGFLRREWFTIRENRPEGMRWVRFWDCAAKTTQGSDYTVGALVGRSQEGRWCIADIVRGRWEYPEARKVILDTAKVDGSEVTIGIEDTSSGIPLLQDIRRSQEAASLTIKAVKVALDKGVRAGPWASAAEGGLIELRRGNWVSAFLDECEAFPLGAHDDQIDAVSGAWGLHAVPSGYRPTFGTFTRKTT